MQTNVVQHT